MKSFVRRDYDPLFRLHRTTHLQNLDFFCLFAPVTALKINDLVFDFQSTTPSVTLGKEARRISNGGGGKQSKGG